MLLRYEHRKHTLDLSLHLAATGILVEEFQVSLTQDLVAMGGAGL